MIKRLPSNASFEEIAAIVHPILERHGVVRAGLFGSFARGEAGAKSDVDMVVEFGEIKPSSSWLRYDIEIELEEKLRRKVDFGQYENFKTIVRENISKDEILITAGATEGIFATIQALVNANEEVSSALKMVCSRIHVQKWKARWTRNAACSTSPSRARC